MGTWGQLKNRLESRINTHFICPQEYIYLWGQTGDKLGTLKAPIHCMLTPAAKLIGSRTSLGPLCAGSDYPVLWKSRAEGFSSVPTPARISLWVIARACAGLTWFDRGTYFQREKSLRRDDNLLCHVRTRREPEPIVACTPVLRNKADFKPWVPTGHVL